MGGQGSGTWYRWNRKTTIEEAKRFDIFYMRKHGLLKANTMGSLSWLCGGRSNGNIHYYCFHDYMQLKYRYKDNGGKWQPVEQRIALERTPCHFGGERAWFLCTGCGRRVGVLMSSGQYFLCRHCAKLPYSSQQEGKINRISRQQHKLGKRIFEYYEGGDGWGKKKGMHWKTFDRLHRRYELICGQWDHHMDNYWEQRSQTKWTN